LQDIRQRWLRLEETRSSMDLLTYALIDAGLAARQWQAVIPICLDLVRSAQQDTLREERLRFLLVAGQQAVAEGKGMEFLPVLKDIELYLPAFKELANSFDDLRRRIHSASISK
ncbi:MAG TPA: hypothetical protein PKD72_12640, partial [Gemmatales bacterium]|nr:hypothetical protein [Gemmatales bacterium]